MSAFAPVLRRSTDMETTRHDDTLARRGFLGRLTLAAAALATRRPRAADAQPRPVPADEGWLRALTAKHRIVFDIPSHNNGRALAQAANFLDTYERDYATPPGDVNLVLGFHGTALPLVLADPLWARYRLGEQYAITDPAAQAPSTRNVFTAANVGAGAPVTAAQTVEALQRRAVRVLACNNTLINMSRRLAAAGLGADATIRQDLAGGLLPNVVLVPDLYIAMSHMQERGIAYLQVG
jgi:intracellular sulfur oxidation DsrE/DsrF family protein